MIVVGAINEISSNGVDPVDGGVAIWADGEFVFAIPEERVTRDKYAGGFRSALRYGLDHLGLKYSEVDAFTFVSYGDSFGHGTDHIVQQAPELSKYTEKIHIVARHHEAHALCAARLSPWDNSLIAVFDNEGQIIGPQLESNIFYNPMERASYFLASNNSLDLLTRDLFGCSDISLGEAYRRFSYYCGFPSHQFAGKTMALAGYGDAQAFGQIQLFSSDPGGINVDMCGDYENPSASVVDFFDRNGISVAAARDTDDSFHADHFNAAAYIQSQLENVVENRLKELLKLTGQNSICLAGGVAYNCRLVAYLEEALNVPIFVPPSPGDQGLGIGAVLAYLEGNGVLPSRYSPNARLGGYTKNSKAEVQHIASNMGIEEGTTLDFARLASLIVDCMSDGGIVALVDGPSEHGRRALGARSLISLPTEGPAERLRSLKMREWFRPFGASILKSLSNEIYSCTPADAFMLRAPKIQNAEKLGILPHVDGTLRAQIVDDKDETLIAEVLRTLVGRGIPGVVVNTSFNLDGDPLVETEVEALQLFERHKQIAALALADSGVFLKR